MCAFICSNKKCWLCSIWEYILRTRFSKISPPDKSNIFRQNSILVGDTVEKLN